MTTHDITMPGARGVLGQVFRIGMLSCSRSTTRPLETLQGLKKKGGGGGGKLYVLPNFDEK